MSEPGGYPLDRLPLTHRLAGALAVREALAEEVDSGLIASRTDLSEWVQLLQDVGVPDRPRLGKYRVRLRSAEPADLEAVYRAWMSPENQTWRGAGETFPFHETEARLFADTDAVLVGEPVGAGRPVSLRCRYGTNGLARFAYLAHIRLDWEHSAGPFAAFEGHVQFIDLAFRESDLRKVMFEVPEPNRWLFDGFVDEDCVATIRKHRFVDGAYVDVHHVSLWREVWEANTAIWRVAPGDLEAGLPRWCRRIAAVGASDG